MKVIECSGTPREIGEQTGEALRDDIRHNAEITSIQPDSPGWERGTLVNMNSKRYLYERLCPHV